MCISNSSLLKMFMPSDEQKKKKKKGQKTKKKKKKKSDKWLSLKKTQIGIIQ